FVLHLFHISVPEPIMSTLYMVGDAAIPVMMVMLGIQLGSIMGVKLNWKVVISSVTLKMIAAPIIAYIFVSIVDVDLIIGAVLIIISVMLTEATTNMSANEFDTE